MGVGWYCWSTYLVIENQHFGIEIHRKIEVRKAALLVNLLELIITNHFGFVNWQLSKNITSPNCIAVTAIIPSTTKVFNPGNNFRHEM